VSTAEAHNSSPQRIRSWQAPTLLVGCSIFVCLIVWWSISTFHPARQVKQAIPIIDLRELTTDSTAAIEGVVTFVNEETRKFYLQDGTAALPLALPDDVTLRAGDRVLVRGVIARSGRVIRASNDIMLEKISTTKLGRAPLPVAEEVEVDDLTDLFEHHLVRTQGIVRFVDSSGTYAMLELSASRPVIIKIPGAQELSPELLDARVRVAGVLAYEPEPFSASYTPHLWVTDASAIEVLEAAGEGVPQVSSVRALVTEPQWLESGRRVRIHARVIAQEGERTLVVENGGLPLVLNTDQADAFSPGRSSKRPVGRCAASVRSSCIESRSSAASHRSVTHAPKSHCPCSRALRRFAS